MPTKLTPELITAAIQGFESQKIHINSQIAELRAMLDGRTVVADSTEPASPRKRRKMSAAARQRIAAAQRKRWAAAKGTSAAPAATAAPKRKRRLSAAGRQNIIAATKKRWALQRAKKGGAAKKAAPKAAAPATT
jgi:peptidoglycan hydrolase CwlO-like protein